MKLNAGYAHGRARVQRTLQTPARAPQEGISVLVVGSFDADLISLLGILGHTAWRISWWPTCVDAVAALREDATRPVVICDSRMPDGDWTDLLARLRTLPQAPATIIASRAADDSLWAEVLSAGVYDVLSKPFEAEEVFRAVSAAYRSWQRRRILTRPA